MTGKHLELIVEGADASNAAAQVKRALAELEPEAHLDVRPREELDPDTRKAVDPISAAALVLSIPSAVVAVMEIVDRIEKRRRAKAVLERLRAVQGTEPSVRLHILLADGPRNVDAIDEDTLLAAAERAGGG